MTRMGYKNFREPVVYILNQELRKRNFKNQINTNLDSEKENLQLPEYPCRLVRDDDKRVIKCVYAESTDLEWYEELIRNSKGKVYQIKTTFPDGSSKTVELYKDIEGKVESIDYV